MSVCLIPTNAFARLIMPPPNNVTAADSDAELVRRLKAREVSAMEDLLRLHGGKLYGVAFQFMRNETEAQDIVQESLLSIWKKIDSFEGRSAFTSWLYRVTANAALMRLRKDKKFSHDVSIDVDPRDDSTPLQLPDTQPLPNGVIQNEELKEHIQRAIDQLPEPYRSAVLLKDVENFSLEEIAEMTNASVAAVKSRLHRARLTLREILMPYLQAREANRL